MEQIISYKTKANLFTTIILSAGVLLVCTGILVLPNSASDGVRQGLTFCSDILIPSLFPFMVVSAFLVKSGLSAKLGALMEPVTRFLFRLPGCTGSTILISLIGGYPTGARGVKALVESEQITQKQAEQMLCFTVGAGPAFVISVVGSGLFGSGQAGIILFCSQILSSILIGILSGVLSKEKRGMDKKVVSKDPCDLSAALVESTADSTVGMINMCAFVVLFSSLLSIINQSGVSDAVTGFLLNIGVSESAAKSFLPILLEVTGGCFNAANAGASPELISFALGWAGACVHFQISSSLETLHFSRMRFTLFRLLHGITAAVLAKIGVSFFPVVTSVFATSQSPVTGEISSHPTGSIALLFLCAFFLLSLTPKALDFRKRKC